MEVRAGCAAAGCGSAEAVAMLVEMSGAGDGVHKIAGVQKIAGTQEI
jgi:hypothetical protein